MVEFRVLGALEVMADGRAVDLGPPKQRALLAILILHANEVVPVDRLIDELWGDRAPHRADHSIQVYVSGLREALSPLTGDSTIVWHAPGYVLGVEPAAIDSRRAEHLVADGARRLDAGDLPGAAAMLDQALSMWRGRALTDFTYEEFAQPEIRRLTEIWLHASELLATAELGLGRTDEALARAWAVVEEDPFRERAREIQLCALYRDGRAAEAIRTYEAFTRMLADELGAEPSPRLRQLGERILVHDPALDLARTAAPAASTEPRNPYKGLRAFGEADAADFFGRAALVDELVDALAAGKRLITIVGPSGSGKSSLIEAGLIPALRSGRLAGSDRWAIARLRLDAHPLDALEGEISGAPADRHLMVVVDQLEQLYLEASEEECSRFLERLVSVATDTAGARVVLALRADFYDRPLADADFAPLFTAGVVNVIPMAAAELEAAIVEPARRVGVGVDPALLAELITDSAGRPGALPLLQHVLAALFENLEDSRLDLDTYRALGGLRGALTRRAERVFEGLDDAGRVAARQLFLRLVRLSDGERTTSRRVTVRELAALEADPVVLSEVLRVFQADRLLVIDREPASGDGTVEVAHEALFAEWDRLAAWVDACRLDLRRHAWLAMRVDEWLSRGRANDDLLAGSRLDEYEAWQATTSFALTVDERAFLDASRERRRSEQAGQRARDARERSLERRARLRLVGLVSAALVLVAAAAWALFAWPGAAPDIVLVYPGSDRGGMYDSIAKGFDEATSGLELDTQVVVESWEGLEGRLRRLADQGVGLIVVGFAWSYPHVHRVAADYPSTLFLAVDYAGDLPNVATVRFAAEQGAYLVGAAAARRTATGTVGVVTQADSLDDWPYVAGFEAGARAVDPAVEVIVAYGYDPFMGPTPEVSVVDVSRATREVYRAGADVVFYTGGEAPFGVFDAAYRESRATGRQHWGIARDADWYVVLPLFSTDTVGDISAWRSHVLTSLITRWDLAISTVLGDYARGDLRADVRRFDLAAGGLELSPSGGAIDAFLPQLGALADRIVSGELVVPSLPPDRGPPH